MKLTPCELNRDIYTGDFSDNSRHGTGKAPHITHPAHSLSSVFLTLYFTLPPPSTIWYMNTWHVAYAGEYVFSSGDTYSGEFRHDKMCGVGTMVYASGDVYAGAHPVQSTITITCCIVETQLPHLLIHRGSTYSPVVSRRHIHITCCIVETQHSHLLYPRTHMHARLASCTHASLISFHQRGVP